MALFLPFRAVAESIAYAWIVPASERQASQLHRVVPWVVSVGVHAVIIVLGFFLTWTVINLAQDRDPIVVQAEFQALSYDPLVTMEADVATVAESPTAPPVPTDILDKSLADLVADMDLSATMLDAPLAAPPAAAEFVPTAAPDSATFVGLTTTNARRIVYVIDASGSMIRSLPIVIDQLQKSLSMLSERQSFGLVFFQHNKALMVPPTTRLVAAAPEAVLDAMRWIDANVIPAGRSNPLAAIEKAIRFDPDVIFLLSENITGSGEFEIDQRDLLALLDQLNPVDRGTGTRRTQINCVQFLDPDPLDTLHRIAERHGGAKGYKFLSRAELGLNGQ